MNRDQPRARLAAAGERFAAAEKAREEAVRALATAMQEARGDVPVAEMARLGHVSRLTAYRLLEK